MRNPGNQVNRLGDTVSLPVTGTDSGGLALSYSATLPPGLSIGSSSGQITGTPTITGTYTATVTATDSSGQHGSTTFTWTVSFVPPQVKVTVTNPGSQTSTASVPISPVQITATDSAGKTLSYSDNGTLPPGLVISSSGQISGTPTTSGPYTVTITATDTSGNTGSTTFTWNVS